FDPFNTPTTLGGVQLLLDGVPQRLRSVTATSAVFIVDAVGQATRQVELRTKGGASLRTQIAVVNAWPGVILVSTAEDAESNIPSGVWVQDPSVPTLPPVTRDPLPVGPAQRPTQVVINGSGWRFASLIKVRLNSIPCQVVAFGPSTIFPGQDELAFLIPPSM